MATGTERKTNRLEAFSDAVLAIGITLPVVAIHPPTSGSLAAGYRALFPDLAAYAASVVVIGLFWAHSHFSGKIVAKTDHGFNLLTVAFLALVTLTPFPARPYFAHFGGTDPDARLAATVYAWALAAPIVVWALRWDYSRWRGMPDPRLAPHYLTALSRKYHRSAAAAVAGAAATWLDPRAIAVAGVVVLAYLWPPAPPGYRPGQEPADELEEADDRAR